MLDTDSMEVEEGENSQTPCQEGTGPTGDM